MFQASVSLVAPKRLPCGLKLKHGPLLEVEAACLLSVTKLDLTCVSLRWSCVSLADEEDTDVARNVADASSVHPWPGPKAEKNVCQFW